MKCIHFNDLQSNAIGEHNHQIHRTPLNSGHTRPYENARESRNHKNQGPTAFPKSASLAPIAQHQSFSPATYVPSTPCRRHIKLWGMEFPHRFILSQKGCFLRYRANGSAISNTRSALPSLGIHAHNMMDASFRNSFPAPALYKIRTQGFLMKSGPMPFSLPKIQKPSKALVFR